MIFSANKISNSQNASAEVIEGVLILSLLNAQEPKIWRMELDKLGTASFELKQDKTSEITKLLLCPKKGTAEIIASFDTKEQALDALMLASNALQMKKSKAPSKKVTAPENPTPVQTKEKSSPWGIALIGAIMVIGLYYYLTTLIPNTQEGFNTGTATSSTLASPEQRTGVPVPADELLGNM